LRNALLFGEKITDKVFSFYFEGVVYNICRGGLNKFTHIIITKNIKPGNFFFKKKFSKEFNSYRKDILKEKLLIKKAIDKLTCLIM